MSTWELRSVERAWQLGVLTLVAAWALVLALPELLDPLTRLLTLGRPGLEGQIVVPLALAAALVLRPSERTLRIAAAIAAIVLAGAVLIPYVAREPQVAAVGPALIVASLACARFPTAAVTLVALLAGFHGTIDAHTALPPRILEDALLAGIVLSALWRLLLRGRTRPVAMRLPVVLLGVYVLASLVAALGAPSIVAGLQAFRASQWYLLAALIIGFAGWDHERRMRMLKGLLAVNLAVAAYAVLRWITGPTDEEAVLAIRSLGIYNTLDGQLRLVGPFPSASDLAAWTVVAVPFCLAMALALRDVWRWVALATAGMGAAVMFETGVRVATAGVVPAVLVVIVLFALGPAFGNRRLLTAYAAAALIVVGGGAAFGATVLTDEFARDRYAKLLTPGDDPSFQARTAKWEAALADIEDQPFGLGLATGGNTAVRYGRFVTAGSTSLDSAYLKVAVEQGFFVLAILVAGLLGLIAACARQVLRHRESAEAGVLVGVAGALTAWLVVFYAGNFIEQQASLNGYLMIALALTLLCAPEDA